MAEKFQPQTFNINSINEGNRFNLSDGISPNAVNAPIEAAAYVQSLATNQPNVENADNVGLPTVSIELAPNGTPRFKFENLKGEAGTDNSQEIDEINSNITAIKKEQSEQNSQIEANNKELHNIKQALLQNEVLVVSKIKNKTTMRVTAGGENIVDEQYTAVKEIKGSTVRCENLAHLRDKTATVNGVVITSDSATGKITIKGTATSNGGRYEHFSETILLKAGVAYSTTIVTGHSGIISWDSVDGSGKYFAWYKTFTPEQDVEVQLGFTVVSGTTYNLEFYPMLNEGANLKEHQPYFSDLKHANISAIKSTGRNLFDNSKRIAKRAVYGSDTITENSGFTMFYIPVPKNTDIVLTVVNTGNAFIALSNSLEVGTPVNNLGSVTGSTPIKTGGYSYVLFSAWTADFPPDTVQFMANIGTEAHPYTPYIETEQYELPQTLELAEYDSFNPQTGELMRQTVQYTCTGKETYADHFNTGYNCVTVNVPYNLQGNVYSYVHNGIYPGIIGIGSQKSIQFNEINSYFSNATEFMNWLKTQYANGTPVIVDCKLETPTIEKIENAPKLYKAWNKGSETVIQGETDNSVFGAMPTITNEYILKIGGETE